MKTKFLFLFLTIIISGCGSKQTVNIKIDGDPPAVTAAVEAQMPADAAALEGFVNNGAPLVLQKAPLLFASPNGIDMQTGYCALVPDNILSQDVQVDKSGSKPVFAFAEGADGKLNLTENGKPVFSYNFGMQLPDTVKPNYERSSYVYPIYDLNGTNITDDFPSDHYHHRGLSWMWPGVWIGGEHYDLWHIKGIRQKFGEWLGQEVGPVCATLGVKNGWHLEDRKVADEYVWLRVFKANDVGRIIDVSLTFVASEAIEFQKKDFKAYGGLCLRFAPRKEIQIHSPEGLLDQDVLRENWVWADQSAKFRGSEQVSGITVFQHKDNPNYPADWILRHYGFTGVSWPGLNEVTFEPNVPVNLKFRIWLHSGNVTEGKVAEAYKAFAEPPIVSLNN